MNVSNVKRLRRNLNSILFRLNLIFYFKKNLNWENMFGINKIRIFSKKQLRHFFIRISSLLMQNFFDRGWTEGRNSEFFFVYLYKTFFAVKNMCWYCLKDLIKFNSHFFENRYLTIFFMHYFECVSSHVNVFIILNIQNVFQHKAILFWLLV